MTRKSTFKPCYVFFILLVIFIFVLEEAFWKAFIKSYLLYLCAGGWRFQRVFFLTIRRDLKGLKAFIMMLYGTYRSKLTKEPFADMFARTLKRYGRDHVVIYFEDQVWTLGHLDDFSNKVANILLRSGFQRGDKLFLLMHNSAAYVGIWLGAAKAGVSTGLLNSNLRQTSLAHCLSTLDAKAIIVGESLRDAFVEIDGPASYDPNLIWYADESACTPDSATSMTTESKSNWNQLLSQASAAAPPKLARTESREKLIYIFTSGTTGLPKAAIITTPRYIMFTFGARYSISVRRSDIIYIPLPIYHSLGGIAGVGQLLLRGNCLVIRQKFSVSNFWSDCIKYKCTVALYIGEICRYLNSKPPSAEDTQHSVRLMFGNGLRQVVWTVFQERFKVPQIVELYGATESNTSIINCDYKVGAIGFLPQTIKGIHPGYLIKMDAATDEPFRDPDTGLCVECEADEVGQLIGRINNSNPTRSFDGYVDGKATEKKVLRNVFRPGDVWFSSGDLVYRDELGYLYFVDRMGDTFRWRGENVATSEVENILLQVCPNTICTVYGVLVPGNEGKAGMAAITVNLPEVSEKEEMDLLGKLHTTFSSQLPVYARPLFIRLCPSIEMTSTFKVRKVELVKAGFNPTATSDHIYWMDPTIRAYRRLDAITYEEFQKGTKRL